MPLGVGPGCGRRQGGRQVSATRRPQALTANTDTCTGGWGKQGSHARRARRKAQVGAPARDGESEGRLRSPYHAGKWRVARDRSRRLGSGAALPRWVSGQTGSGPARRTAGRVSGSKDARVVLLHACRNFATGDFGSCCVGSTALLSSSFRSQRPAQSPVPTKGRVWPWLEETFFSGSY